MNFTPFILSSILVLSLILRLYFCDSPKILYSEYLLTNELFNFMFFNNFMIYGIHILGIFLSFCSTILLGCNLYISFLALFFYFVIPNPFVDCIYAFIASNYFIVTLSISLNIPFISYLCIIISGISVAGCVLILPELYVLPLFSFFSYLFFWLKNHNIHKHSKKTFIDAFTTFFLFIISFLGAFIIEGIFTSFPKLSNETFSAKNLFFIFPSLHSKIFLSGAGSLFAHHKSTTELLTIACIVCAVLFRFKTVTTPGAGLSLASAVSTKFFDVAALALISGTESKFLGVLALPILLLLVILGMIFQF